MKKLIYGIAIFGILTSCNEEIKKTATEIKLSEELSPIEDPNLFIGKHKTKAMVLGVFHFNFPGLDSHQSKYQVNVLDAQRQEEIEYLLEKISKFKPTKILLEYPRNRDSIMNARYEDFLNKESDSPEYYQNVN